MRVVGVNFDKESDDLLSKVSQKVFEVSSVNVMAAVTELKDRGDDKTSDHLYVTLSAAAGTMQLAAKLMTMPEKAEDLDEWVEGPVNRVAIIAAALLMARCFIPHDNGYRFEFNPINIRAALEATKKILGSEDISMFTKRMVEAANKFPCPEAFLNNSGGMDNVSDLSAFRTLN